ncbi:PAS domain-containing protein [candidate division WWE3 bacterium]|uniref:PAS domain-containing protein n=1 Tax=candidate division WWE3 bacterium TaxID=2053526 RepID=A0A928TRF8_UNCKA|nr:PAS domain-containing protein [candidate division WWE3 bacterium]
MIISTTNLKGILTSANEDFIRMSGFSWEELENKNHNIIRHPDVPPEAYAMLWEALKAGNPWMGMVKTVTKWRSLLGGCFRQSAIRRRQNYRLSVGSGKTGKNLG